jgi:hypothetical protein
MYSTAVLCLGYDNKRRCCSGSDIGGEPAAIETGSLLLETPPPLTRPVPRGSMCCCCGGCCRTTRHGALWYGPAQHGSAHLQRQRLLLEQRQSRHVLQLVPPAHHLHHAGPHVVESQAPLTHGAAGWEGEGEGRRITQWNGRWESPASRRRRRRSSRTRPLRRSSKPPPPPPREVAVDPDRPGWKQQAG